MFAPMFATAYFSISIRLYASFSLVLTLECYSLTVNTTKGYIVLLDLPSPNTTSIDPDVVTVTEE